MCDVKVSQDGRIEIITSKERHTAELDRIGVPEKTIRGRVNMVENDIVFTPYAEASRKPTYEKKVVVGSTTIQCTEDKVKFSFLVPRHLRKELMVLYVQSEIDEVKRRLNEDVYDLVASPVPSQGGVTQEPKTEAPSNPSYEGGNSSNAENGNHNS